MAYRRSRRLQGVMDATAFALAREESLHIIVFLDSDPEFDRAHLGAADRPRHKSVAGWTGMGKIRKSGGLDGLSTTSFQREGSVMPHGYSDINELKRPHAQRPPSLSSLKLGGFAEPAEPRHRWLEPVAGRCLRHSTCR